MTLTSKQAELILEKEFAPSVLEVLDESSGHGDGTATGTHFRVRMVSEAFAGLSAVKKHQLVYRCFKEHLKQGLHALAMELYSCDEWQTKNEVFSQLSPDCQHAT